MLGGEAEQASAIVDGGCVCLRQGGEQRLEPFGTHEKRHQRDEQRNANGGWYVLHLGGAPWAINASMVTRPIRFPASSRTGSSVRRDQRSSASASRRLARSEIGSPVAGNGSTISATFAKDRRRNGRSLEPTSDSTNSLAGRAIISAGVAYCR